MTRTKRIIYLAACTCEIFASASVTGKPPLVNSVNFKDRARIATISNSSPSLNLRDPGVKRPYFTARSVLIAGLPGKSVTGELGHFILHSENANRSSTSARKLLFFFFWGGYGPNCEKVRRHSRPAEVSRVCPGKRLIFGGCAFAGFGVPPESTAPGQGRSESESATD